MWCNLALLQRSLWLAYLLLALLIVALGTDIVKSYRHAPRPLLAPTPPPHSLAVSPPRRVDYQIIAQRNIFNASLPTTRAASEDEPSSFVTPTPAPGHLKLVGTVTSSEHQDYAIIEDLHQQGAQTVYQIGDTIQGARLADIRPTCIVLDQSGQEAWLCF